MNDPEITQILDQYSTHELGEVYLWAEERGDWLIDDFWREMPKKYLIAELFRRVSALEDKLQ